MRLAFGCQKRVGKDAACEYLQQKYSGEILHFADKLKELQTISQEFLGFEKQKDREFLQTVGTWARNRDSDVWVRSVTGRIVSNDVNYFVGDVRYPNEYRALKALGFTIVRIERPDVVNNDSHSSENALNSMKFDEIIVNDGTLEKFYEKLDRIYNKEFSNKK